MQWQSPVPSIIWIAWKATGAKNGYPWPVAIAVNESQALADLNVAYQSTKIAFNSQGVITYREGFGGGSADVWRQVFSDLANQ